MKTLNETTLRDLPKADLHVHLDGSLRLSSLIELAKEQKIELPSYSEAGLRELVFKNQYKDLPDYLQGFQFTCGVMQDLQALERVAYEFAWDAYHDGVVYIEPRYSPDLLKSNKTKSHEVISSIDKGLKRASLEINALIDKENLDLAQEQKPLHPAFVYSHIICAMRMWDPQQSLETIQSAMLTKEKHNLPIMAIDLAGPEDGFPAIDHADAYTYAHKNFLYKTVHAGEAYGPSSIFQAITNLYADRIGHGFHLFNKEMINTKDPSKANNYVDNLVQYIAEKRITLEVCLTSNLQTLPELNNDPANHSLAKMLEHGISVAICTDNTLVSNTTISKELSLAAKTFNLSNKTIKKLIMYGIKRSFYPGSYLEKKKYIDQCSKYYDFIAEQ
ncbi:MAG: adenosine deaminase family protein [Cyanobacteria bacterium]|nr:adenosine deaminase family protein [Cyanobacteriota bacterium]MDA1020440.1 adenosine deaminase family protein [Cyanobacteriota bacterium]